MALRAIRDRAAHRLKNALVMDLSALRSALDIKIRMRCSRSNPTMESIKERMSGFAAASANAK